MDRVNPIFANHLLIGGMLTSDESKERIDQVDLYSFQSGLRGFVKSIREKDSARAWSYAEAIYGVRARSGSNIIGATCETVDTDGIYEKVGWISHGLKRAAKERNFTDVAELMGQLLALQGDVK